MGYSITLGCKHDNGGGKATPTLLYMPHPDRWVSSRDVQEQSCRATRQPLRHLRGVQPARDPEGKVQTDFLQPGHACSTGMPHNLHLQRAHVILSCTGTRASTDQSAGGLAGGGGGVTAFATRGSKRALPLCMKHSAHSAQPPARSAMQQCLRESCWCTWLVIMNHYPTLQGAACTSLSFHE